MDEDLKKLMSNGWSYRKYGSSGGSDDTQTYILVDESGNEVPATLVEKATVFNATANDIRIGAVAATDSGVTVGEKEIPAYYTSAGRRVVTNGSKFILPVDLYDYTKILAVICPFNTSLSDSMATEKIAINGYVYPALSAVYESEIVKDHDNLWIDFGSMNDSGSIYLIRYILYKEIY